MIKLKSIKKNYYQYLSFIQCPLFILQSVKHLQRLPARRYYNKKARQCTIG